MDKKKIIAGVASIEERVSGLEQTVNSLLPQVDKLGVCLNNYSHVPSFLEHPKIEVASSDNTYGDAGKFMFMEYDSIYFSCDDDLLYPPSYVDMTLPEIRGKRIVSYHGRIIINSPIKSAYRDPCLGFSCIETVLNTGQVHVGGTGVMAFEPSQIQLNMSDFYKPNMADELLAVYAANRRIPIYILAHPSNWVEGNIASDNENTIFAEHADDCQQQTDILNEIYWPHHPIRLPYA